MKNVFCPVLLILSLSTGVSADPVAPIPSSEFNLSVLDIRGKVQNYLATTLKKDEPPATLRYEKECILRAVAMKMGVKLRSDIPLPPVYLASKTPLEQFQDAVEPQWGMRPHVVLNVYVFALNEIYLLDEARYYDEVGRFLDDSLAHEYAHYIQVKYQNGDLVQGGDALEFEAVEVQKWFRANYLWKPGKCPGS